jgi:hypothetical protein
VIPSFANTLRRCHSTVRRADVQAEARDRLAMQRVRPLGVLDERARPRRGAPRPLEGEVVLAEAVWRTAVAQAERHLRAEGAVAGATARDDRP